jgi:general secretion pathway protein A
VDRLHLLLIDEYKQGRTVVLIIDEAQNMPIETLENLRMLSNLETSKDKLIQIVLVGQPEFEEKLNLKELRQLNQRIIMRAHIQPISRRESVAYIQHRLSKAGRKDIDIFSKSALRLIIRHARGIPRILSVLCGNALVTGVGYQEKQITARTAREVIADFEGTKKMNPLKWLLVAISLAVIISGIAVIYQHQGHVLSSARELFNYRSPETRKTEAETVVVTEPVKAPPIKIEVAQPAEKETSKPADNTSKSEENKSKPAKSKFPIKKVVNKGDTLYSLVREVYGKSSNELIALVKKQNTRIGKDGKIQTGERLNFPEPANRKSADDN